MEKAFSIKKNVQRNAIFFFFNNVFTLQTRRVLNVNWSLDKKTTHNQNHIGVCDMYGLR